MIYTNNLLLVSVTNSTTRNKQFINILLYVTWSCSMKADPGRWLLPRTNSVLKTESKRSALLNSKQLVLMLAILVIHKKCFLKWLKWHAPILTRRSLTSSLPNTGMPPHFYITADKSTNCRITNQVTVICPIVNGTQERIILDARDVYTNSDGTGGTGGLFIKIWRSMSIWKMNSSASRGKNVVMQLFEDGQSCKDRLWWPIEWDPAHWLDKVFSKIRVSLIVYWRESHFSTRFGRMHSSWAPATCRWGTWQIVWKFTSRCSKTTTIVRRLATSCMAKILSMTCGHLLPSCCRHKLNGTLAGSYACIFLWSKCKLSVFFSK